MRAHPMGEGLKGALLIVASICKIRIHRSPEWEIHAS